MNQSKLITVDNLEINFLGVIPLQSDSCLLDAKQQAKKYYYNLNVYIEYTSIRTASYEHIAYVFIDGRNIGEIRFSPAKGFLPVQYVSFKFNNVILYQQDYNKYIDIISENMTLKYLGISHIDVAVDAIDLDLQKFTNHYIYTSSPLTKISEYKTKHKGRINLMNVTTNHINVLHWGKLSQEKYLKIYDKTKELEDNKEKHNKDYIKKWWQANGLDFEGKKVERFELTLRQKHAKHLDYTKLCDCNYLASILKTHCKNFYQFEKTYINHGKEYKKDVTPIKFTEFNTVLLPKYKHIAKHSLATEKRTLKNLYMSYLLKKFIASDNYVKTGELKVPNELKDYHSIIIMIENLNYEHPSLFQYYNTKKWQWEQEWKETNEVYRGAITINEYIESVQLTQKCTFITSADFDELIDGEEFIYDLPLLKQMKRSFKLANYNLHHFNNFLALDNLAEKSEHIKKISLPIRAKLYHEIKQESQLNKIA